MCAIALTIATLPLPTRAAQPARPVVPLLICRDAPKVDGALDDACWKSAYMSPTFYDFELKSEAYTPNPDTTLRLVTDGKWLYFGVECRHPTPEDMRVSIKENFGGRVFGDECIKFFINPGLEGSEHYRYVLNCENVHTIRRSFSTSAPSMAWPSATALAEHGWAAEVAVPLFHLAGFGDLSRFRLNVLRKKILKQYDSQHVEVGAKGFISSWSPTDEWLNMAEFGRIEGLGTIRLEFPFVANADHVSVGDLYEADGQVRYDVSLTLKALTAQGGRAVVEVIERLLAEEPKRTTKSFPLASHQVCRVTVPVTVERFGQREVVVVVRDAQTGLPFQTIQVRDTSGFQLLQARTRLNYYTSEPSATVLYTVGMPSAALAGKRLVVRGAAGRTLAHRWSPGTEGELTFPLTDVTTGTHTLTLALEGDDGRKVFEALFELIKLPPRPGCEWKIDRGTGGTLFDNGKPFFPFGMLVDYDEHQYAEIAEAGFNTAVWWRTYADIPTYPEVGQLAAKHGLKFIVLPQRMVENRAAQVPVLKELFSGEEYGRVVRKARNLLRVKGMLLAPPFTRLTRAQRTRIFDEFVDLYLPVFRERVRSVMSMPNLIGYDTLDEPGFSAADLHLALRRMYLDLRKVDPYHPVFVLYSSRIPPGPKATCFADCLGTDPYWTPGRSLPRGSINWMSTTTAKTVARARDAGMCPFTIPMSTLWSDQIKRMISGPEQICQTYLALIHGTKAIFYFTHWFVAEKGQWEAMKTLGARIKELAPALTAAEPPQNITYKPGAWAPLEGKVPDVQARLVRFPDGRHALLAANVRRSPVQVRVQIGGLKDTELSDLFDGPIGAVNDGAFVDTLGPQGVRTYALGRIDREGVVRIAIKVKRLGKEGDIEAGFRHEGRKGQRNIQPNPSFEEATIPGFPDYFRPYGPHKGWRKRVGEPGAPVGLAEENPFHGKRCLFIDDSVRLYWRMAPQHETQQLYVLSFYARAESDSAVALNVGWSGVRRARPLRVEGREWKRYALRFEVPAKVDERGAAIHLRSTSSDRVYLDAVQLEKGLEPTEFQP